MPSPRERRRDLTSQRILAAARKILLQSGLQGFSIRSLAAQVDYSATAIYRYYANKEAILQAIRKEGWELALHMQKRRMVAEQPIEEQLIAAGLAYQEFASTYPEHYMLMFDSPDLPPSGLAGIKDDPNFAPLIKLIDAGVASERFVLPANMNALMLGFMFWTSSHGMAMVRIKFMRHDHREYDQMCEQVIRNFVLSLIKQ